MKAHVLAGLAALLLVMGGCAGGAPKAPAVGARANPPTGLDPSFGRDGVLPSPLSPTEDDRFLAVTPGPDGSWYAAGFTSAGDDHAMALAKLGKDGALDARFGRTGVASVNVAPGGKQVELARAVVVQSDGKVVVSGQIEHDSAATGPAAKDTDIALVRFDDTGRPDPTFGKDGVARIDLGTGREVSADSFVGDNAWGLVALPGNRLALFGSTLAPGRSDADFVLLGLTSQGAIDSGFGDRGRVTIDLNRSADSPRNLLLQPDGKIVATGYSRDASGTVSPVLVRTSTDGKLDPSFGTGGVATAQILPGGVVESYQLGRQGDAYVLVGYGRGPNLDEKVDLVSVRFTGDGRWDRSYGNEGLTRIDIAGDADRGRNLVVLPDRQLLVVGVGTPKPGAADAMVVLLDGNGTPVRGFGTNGMLLSDLGGPADAWFGAALAPDGRSVLIAGYKGREERGEGNDDAALARVAL